MQPPNNMVVIGLFLFLMLAASGFVSPSPQRRHSVFLDPARLHTKLRASSTLRDNLVNTMGYLLYKPDTPLTRDQYTSLTLVYHAVRLRHVRTLHLVRQLKKAASQPPSMQCITLLEEILRHAPKYLSSALVVVLDSVKENRTIVDEGFPQLKQSLKLGDFLTGIEKDHLDLLQRPVHFHKDSVDRSTVTLVGPEFGQILAAISDKDIPLTSILFAEILLHFPMDQIEPQSNEMLRLLVQNLREYDEKEWSDLISHIPPDSKTNLLTLIRSVLRLMNTANDPKLQEPSLYILPHFMEPTATFSNPAYETLSPFLNKRMIDVISHLKAISPPDYPEEILYLRKSLTDYLDNEWWDQDTLLKDFVRYDFVKPVDFVIAILTRMANRMKQLPQEMVWTIKTLISYLVFKKMSWEKPPHLPVGSIDLALLTDSFMSPYMPNEIRASVFNVLVPSFVWNATILTQVLKETTVAECNRPKKCLVRLLKKALGRDLLKAGVLLNTAEYILSVVDDEGNPTIAHREYPEDGITPSLRDSGFPDEVSQVAETEKNQIADTNLTIDSRNSSQKGDGQMLERSFGYPEINGRIGVSRFPLPFIGKQSRAAILYALSPHPAQHSQISLNYSSGYYKHEHGQFNSQNTHRIDTTQQPWQKEISSIMDNMPDNILNIAIPQPDSNHVNAPVVNGESFAYLLPPTVQGSPEHLRIAALRTLLSMPNLAQFLGEAFRPEDYPLKGKLLQEILQRVLQKNLIRNEQFNADVRQYLTELEMIVCSPEVNWETLLPVIPQPETDEERNMYAEMREFLKPSLKDVLGPSFDPTLYKKKGILLKNILDVATTLDEVKNNSSLLEAVEYYLPKVTMDEEGSKPVEYVVVQP